MLNQIIKYLEETVQDHIELHKWRKSTNLIFRFQDRFEYYEVNLLGYPIVLMEEKDSNATLKEMTKLITMIKKQDVDYCAMIFTDITSYKRKKMIQERIPFIISNGQIYLPFLGLDLAFRTNKEVIKPVTFTPTAQLLYLYFLYNKPTEVSTEHISNLFKISKVHAARALRELYEKKLITFEVGGSTNRTRKYKRVKDPEYYQQGLRYLKNPVIGDILCTSETKRGPKCGLSALADQSMLAQPEYDTYAITKEERNHIAHNANRMYHDFELIKLEVWSYDPRILSKDKYVDILSLCLSLQHLDDPRVDEEIEKLLKGESWYRA